MADDVKVENKGSADFKASFSMGQYDYQRFHAILFKLDECSIALQSGDYTVISSYYALLKTLYRSWRPLIYPAKQEEIEALFKSVKAKSIETSQNATNNDEFTVETQLLDDLDTIHTELMSLKQIIGLGIEVVKSINASKKLKEAFKG